MNSSGQSKIVFAVESLDYDYHETHAVFSTREGAERWMEMVNARDRRSKHGMRLKHATIEPMALDPHSWADTKVE